MEQPVKTQHTPGPLEPREDNDGCWFVENLQAGEGEPGAITASYCTKADARLYAAAPELLRELQHLVRLLEPLERDVRLDVPGLATLNGARAAIARATGQ